MSHLAPRPIKVIEYSSYKSPELPRFIEWEGGMVQVVAIGRQWKEIDLNNSDASMLLCFDVRLETGESAVVFYREKDQSWFLKE